MQVEGKIKLIKFFGTTLQLATCRYCKESLIMTTEAEFFNHIDYHFEERLRRSWLHRFKKFWGVLWKQF